MEPATDYDVVVIGGSIAGGATALQLLRRRPETRVLVVEHHEHLGRRVGESTVELSTYFLTRTLGLTKYLNETQVVKQGFRFWFMNERADCFSSCTEMGGRYHSRVGSFQLDREAVDAEVLRRCVERGAEVWRPARVKRVDLEDGGTQTVMLRTDVGERAVTCRWVVDATGRNALLARRRGGVTPLEEHPTGAVWARFRGTVDFDGHELLDEHPALRKNFFGTRHTATNHVIGDGWWCWLIPLKNGDTSVGVVWDERFYAPPTADADGTRLTREGQLRATLDTHPVGRRLLRDAVMVEDDVELRRNLPFFCDRAAGDGFAAVGDAAGFIDPFYSMGLDALAIVSSSAVGVMAAALDGEDVAARLEKHNAMVGDSYRNWYEAIYQDKYACMGDFELMRVAFLNDISLYYFGIVMPPYRAGDAALRDGMFHTPPSRPFFWFIRGVNRRLADMALDRRRRGTFGRRNHGRRNLVGGFAFDAGLGRASVKVLWLMLKLELGEGWRTWFRRPARPTRPGVVRGGEADAGGAAVAA